jgi:D-alanyl-D-alanine carboxypeptidase
MKKYTLFLLIVLTAFAGQVKSQFPTTYGNRLQFVLDSVCNVYDIKGVSAAVTIPGLGTWEGTYGISQVGVPINSSMVLGIGSNTKTYVATTILKMEEQNLIHLTDTVGIWIHHPNVNGQITIKQLLNHTSGVFSYTEHPNWDDSVVADLTRIWVPDSVLQFIDAPYFAPGMGWQYSNSNYLLLGLIIRDVMGQPLSTVIRNLVLNPSTLNNTFLYPEEAPTSVIPHIWSANFNAWGNNLEDLVADYGYNHNAVFSMAWAAGGIISTAEDNSQFWSKWITGQILNSASLVKMKQSLSIGSGVAYGLGVFRYNNFNGRRIYTHGGTNLGFINENLADSVSGAGISVLTNQDSISNSLLLTKVVSALHKVTINPPLSVEGVSANGQVLFYPNPMKNNLQFHGLTASKTYRITVSDLSGKQVFEGGTENNSIRLPVIPAGAYMVSLKDQDGVRIAKQLITVQQ